MANLKLIIGEIMAEIPPQFDFEHMLSHMFPGIFTAVTVFMVLDIWSPLVLIEFINKDFNALLGFLAFIVLSGTIIGVIIDGLHHKILEEHFFENFERNPSIRDLEKGWGCKDNRDNRICKKVKAEGFDCKFIKPLSYEPIKVYYLFNAEGLDKYVKVHEYITRSYYYYYEFFANAFISLIPFTLVAPIYINKELQIPAERSIFIGIMLAISAMVCLWISITAYDRYIAALYFAILNCHRSDGSGKKN